MQSLKNGADTVAAGTANLAKSAATLGDAVEPLTTFSTMAQTMLGAVNQLKEASDTLTANDTTLNTGAAALAEGTKSLNSGLTTLASGASALSDGVTQLAQGLRIPDSGNRNPEKRI